jgi:phage terminase large subunit GpA-like protein
MKTQLKSDFMRGNVFRFCDAERMVFKAREKIKVSEHAEKYRVVATGKSQGKWRNDLAPYAVEPMDTFALPWVRKIFLEWAPQTSKTSTAINCLDFCIDIAPGPAFYIMPDEKVAKRIAKRQLITTFRQTPKIAELLSPRADDVSTLHIKLQNGMDLMMAWASSAASIASESAQYIFYDEPAKYPEFSGREADPFTLGDQRQNRYESTSKQMYFSTPNLKGDAFDTIIENEADEVRRYYAVCPFCQHPQIMKFRQIHWQGVKDHKAVLRKKLARYTCVKCGLDWDDYTRNKAVLAGFWKADQPVERPIAVAFRELASWYSTVSMSKSAWAFMLAHKNPEKLQGFWTQYKCIPWEERITTQNEKKLLEHCNDIPAGIVPSWAVALTAGIDSQKRGFWFVVRAWGADLTSHLVQYGYLPTFDDVRALVFGTRFQIEAAEGQEQSEMAYMSIWRAAMDTGGGETDDNEISRTEEVYDFIATHGSGVIHGIKGAKGRQFSIVGPEREVESRDRRGRRRKFRGKLYLRMLDTYQLKVLLHNRLDRREARVDDDGTAIEAETQRFYLHSGTGMDYAKQFLAEELKKNRKGQKAWVQKARDNHLLDCEVYAAAAAHYSWFPNLTGLARHLKNEKKLILKPENDEHKSTNSTPAAEKWIEKTVARRGSWLRGT